MEFLLTWPLGDDGHAPPTPPFLYDDVNVFANVVMSPNKNPNTIAQKEHFKLLKEQAFGS